MTPRQRDSLAAAIDQRQGAKPADAVNPRETVSATLHRLNCYACHARDGIGGIEPERNPFFQTRQQEMGDEGRIPPALDGVGAKLNAKYLAHILNDEAKDRP